MKKKFFVILLLVAMSVLMASTAMTKEDEGGVHVWSSPGNGHTYVPPLGDKGELEINRKPAEVHGSEPALDVSVRNAGAPDPIEPPVETPAPEPTPAPAPAARSHVVVAGDTLSVIAAKYGTTWQVLAEKNGIANPNVINIGQVLQIPAATTADPIQAPGESTSPAAPPVQAWGYQVAAGDTLSGIAARYKLDMSSLAKTNNLNPPYLIVVGQILKVEGVASAPTPTQSPTRVRPATQTPAPMAEAREFRWRGFGLDPYGDRNPAIAIRMSGWPQAVQNNMIEWAKANPNPAYDGAVTRGDRLEWMAFGRDRAQVRYNVVADWANTNVNSAPAAAYDFTFDGTTYRLLKVRQCFNWSGVSFPAIETPPVFAPPQIMIPPTLEREEAEAGPRVDFFAGGIYNYGLSNDLQGLSTRIGWADLRLSPYGFRSEGGWLHNPGIRIAGYAYEGENHGYEMWGHGISVGAWWRAEKDNVTIDAFVGPGWKTSEGRFGDVYRDSKSAIGLDWGLYYGFGDQPEGSGWGGRTTFGLTGFWALDAERSETTGAPNDTGSWTGAYLGLTQDIYRWRLSENWTGVLQAAAKVGVEDGLPMAEIGLNYDFRNRGLSVAKLRVGVDFIDPGTFGFVAVDTDIGNIVRVARMDNLTQTTNADLDARSRTAVTTDADINARGGEARPATSITPQTIRPQARMINVAYGNYKFQVTEDYIRKGTQRGSRVYFSDGSYLTLTNGA